MHNQDDFDKWNSMDVSDGKDRQASKEEASATSDRETIVSNREAEIKRIEALEELAGVGFNNAYGTTSRPKFVEKVQAMGLDQMRELAVRVGVIPTTREKQLRDSLIENFEQYIASERAKIRGPRKSPSRKHPAIKKLEDEGLLDS